ncbi:MAG: tyrosine-type recombinase/integrase [Lachnospiraceae bacterium]|jgi:site-specific recombinase XerD|nr:tyrosine-type recombinase/integrase [Lachnospiraceae bacterium]MDD4524502.1 tyrosine-type recombinase/integrase [Lachnospiraceae bacterium]
MQGQTDKYYEEKDRENTLKMRAVLDTLPRFCRQFFRGIEQNTLPRTRLAYAYDLRVFFEFLHNTNPACKKQEITDYSIDILKYIQKEDIEEYLEYCTYYEKGGKIITNDERGKARKLSTIRKMFHYFYCSEQIDEDVAEKIPLPKQHEKAIIRLEPDEVAILLDQVDSGASLTKHELAFHERTRIRDIAILTLMLGTGIRVSECVGLDIQDIDFNENGIKIHRKGGYEAIVYFGDEVEKALKEYLRQREKLIPVTGNENALFLSLQDRRLTVRAVENLVKKYASRVTTLKKITPHKLRSTYGTSLYRETGDIYLVADVLGHKDVNTTRKHYAAIEEDRRRSAANVVKLREDVPDKVKTEAAHLEIKKNEPGIIKNQEQESNQ